MNTEGAIEVSLRCIDSGVYCVGLRQVRLKWLTADIYIPTYCNFMGLRCRSLEEENRKLPGHVCGTRETQV